MNSLRKIPGIVICFHKMVGRMIPRLFSASTAIGEFSFHKRLLMWDANKCHTDETVWAHTISLHLCTAIVPGGCTKFIQAAAHVAWNASLKTTMRSHYVTQIITSTKEEEIWEYLLVNCCVIASKQSASVKLIKSSFKFCAITTPIDGSGDDETHCFRPQQPCAAGLSLLWQTYLEMTKVNRRWMQMKWL